MLTAVFKQRSVSVLKRCQPPWNYEVNRIFRQITANVTTSTAFRCIFPMAIDRGNDDFLLATFICLKNRPLAIAEVYDIDVARHTSRVARFFFSRRSSFLFPLAVSLCLAEYKRSDRYRFHKLTVPLRRYPCTNRDMLLLRPTILSLLIIFWWKFQRAASRFYFIFRGNSQLIVFFSFL